MMRAFRPKGPSSRAVAAADLNRTQCGQRALVYYQGSDTVWHERLLLWPCSADRSVWAVLTPDLEVYVEALQGGDMATHLILLTASHFRLGY